MFMNDLSIASSLISLVIDSLIIKNERLIIAIDGVSASGKSTLASHLALKYDCNIFHMDDFFLRKEQRTKERYALTGGNIDIERFNKEIVSNIKSSNDFRYRVFDCKSMTLGDEKKVHQKRINIIEGVYSMHPAIASEYDYKVLLKIPEELQNDRLLKRNGFEGAKIYRERWIPLETRYFEEFKIFDNVDLVISMGDE